MTINNDRVEKKLIISNRRVYASVKYDTTIIEIFENKDGINNFLELDFDIKGADFNNKYINKSIYTLQYPNHDKVYVSYGIIKSIDVTNNYDFRHYCSTDKGSSGAPILNIKTNKIIGIHKGAYNNYNFNKGTLLIYPLKEFISQIEKNVPNNPKKMILKPTFKKLRKEDISPSNFGGDKRLIIEYKNTVKDKVFDGFQLFGLIENMIHGVLEGPPDTFYENGFFQFILIYPTNDYPWKPPQFYFKTKVFHPNIDEFGLVSANFLGNDWGSYINLSKIIISVQALLDYPNPDDFVNEEAAKLYKENLSEYEKTVRKYTTEYANFETVQNDLKKLNFKMELGD